MPTLFLLIPILIVIILASVRIIQQYETGVVFQLGKYSRTLQPGLNFIIPVIEYSRTIDMRVSTNDIPKQQVITKDNVPVAINGVVYFKVVDWLVSKPGHLPPVFPESMITKILNFLLNRFGHLGYYRVTNPFLVERLDEFVVEESRVGTNSDSVEVFGNFSSAGQPKRYPHLNYRTSY